MEDGTVFEGSSFGAPVEHAGEVVFNTSLTGYQEIFTDPSYAGQIVVLTNPQIGNYGANDSDNESVKPYIEGLVVREFSPLSSNWRADETAQQFLTNSQVPVVAGIDTRRSCVTCAPVESCAVSSPAIGGTKDELVQRAKSSPSMAGLDLASRVSTPKIYEWSKAVELCSPSDLAGTAAPPRFHVVAYDYGMKRNILRRLVQVGCRLTVVPAGTTPLPTCWRSNQTACFSLTDPAIRSLWNIPRLRWRNSSGTCQFSGFAWATRFLGSPSAARLIS